MISAHSSADVCSRCTHSLKVSESSIAKTRAKLAQAESKTEQTVTTTKVSETGEEFAGICVSNSWVKLVTTTVLLLNIFYYGKLFVLGLLCHCASCHTLRKF